MQEVIGLVTMAKELYFSIKELELETEEDDEKEEYSMNSRIYFILY